MWKTIGVKIDVNLNFDNHISDLCKKASRKISALGTVAPLSRYDTINFLKFHC